MLAINTGLAMGHAVVSHIYKQHHIHHSLESSANLFRGGERQQYFVLAPKAMGMHQVVSGICSMQLSNAHLQDPAQELVDTTADAKQQLC